MPRWLLILFCLLVPAGLIFLYAVPPFDSPFYPRCVLFSTTGWHCPGCGTARCLYSLLHGRILQALAYNAMVLFVLPIFVIEGYRIAYASLFRKDAPEVRYPALLLRGLVIAVVAYWLLRNLPWFPFTLLAPHAI
jgi:hypothetical protein